MIAELKSHFDFYVVTRDRDATDTEPYPEVQVDRWNGVAGARVFYCSSVNKGLLQRIVAEVQPELILLNSFHEKLTRLMLLLRRSNGLGNIPVIVAPRGEFSPGALAIKRWKKASYRLLTQSIGLYDDLRWQVTSAREKEDFLQTRPARRIDPACVYVTHNISDAAPSTRPHPPKSSGAVDLVFISRISLKKNLHFLLDALRDMNGKVQLTIFGPVADSDVAYWNRCKKLLPSLPENVTIQYKGPLDHAGVADQLHKHHFFVLPTKGENFCHAAVESFVNGTPVVISDETPWTGLAQARAGFDLPLADRGQWVRALQHCCDMDQQQYDSFLKGAREYRKQFSARHAVQEYLTMFDSALSLRPQEGPVKNSPGAVTYTDTSSAARGKLASDGKVTGIQSTAARASIALKALKTLGPGWAFQRGRVALETKLGVVERKTPLQSWDDLSLIDLLKKGVPNNTDTYPEWRRKNTPPFFFDSIQSQRMQQIVGKDSVRVADRIVRGELPFFGYTQDFGWPVQWQKSPIDHSVPSGGHWSRINEFDSGDIKFVWEASRFGWSFALARAFSKTLDARYAEAFWELLENWMIQNPPQWGVNWKCGQEASFRVMALCFAFYIFRECESTSAERIACVLRMIGAHARRISAYTSYARSQKNNHAISEGVGLWTIGLLFPELSGAERWKADGRRLVESEARRQIYSDGSYIQHSMNYHRVMLHDLAWALRLGECHGEKLDDDIYERFARGTTFLRALTDPDTGSAPNIGANDGALVLPLSDCAYPDMRPVLQSCHFIAAKERLFPPGPWDEEMAWLSGISSLGSEQAAAAHPAEVTANIGGYFTLRSDNSWLVLRATTYRDRPSHADQLHLDLWWRGHNVLLDSGTYSYNATESFHHAFASTRYHNTVTVDDSDQMSRLSRFLWADWANATVRRIATRTHGDRGLVGEHDGYKRAGVTHCRAVVEAGPDSWVIVDDLIGEGHHKLSLHWLAADAPFTVVSEGAVTLTFDSGDLNLAAVSNCPATFDIVRAGERIVGDDRARPDNARGWHSRYYGRMDPALSFAMVTQAQLPVRFITVISAGTTPEFEIDPSLLLVSIGSKRIELTAPGVSPIFA